MPNKQPTEMFFSIENVYPILSFILITKNK